MALFPKAGVGARSVQRGRNPTETTREIVTSVKKNDCQGKGGSPTRLELKKKKRVKAAARPEPPSEFKELYAARGKGEGWGRGGPVSGKLGKGIIKKERPVRPIFARELPAKIDARKESLLYLKKKLEVSPF